MADIGPNQDLNPIQGVATNIFSQIRKEQWDYMFNWIQIVPGYPFNTYWTIKRIHLYLNSRFEDATTFNGREKIFFNIVLPPCEVAMRMLNIDTKNIRLWPLNPESEFSTYLLEKELRVWLKGHKFGKVLNQLAEEAPRLGSVVLEKTPDGANVVDLRRIILDPTVEHVQDSRFVTTISYMTPTQMRDTKGWDTKAVETAIQRFQNANTTEPYEDQIVNANIMRSTPYIKVFKRYGEVPMWWVDDKAKPGTKAGDKLVKSVFIVAGADLQEKNQEGKPVGELGVVLFKSVWRKEWPFKDFHYMKTKGRWLGIGIVEMLFDVQERVNEMKNQKRLAMEISSMHLFQTKDKSIVRNVLTDLQSGDLMLSPNGIEPIATEERGLAAFKDEEESYGMQTDKLSFAYEALRGDTGDASTPLGTTQIAVAQGTSVFAFKKENLSIFIQDFFNDLVLPELMKDMTPEHIMRFTGTAQELQKLDQAASEVYANDYIKSEILKGSMVTPEHMDMAKQHAVQTYQKLGVNRFLKMKENFYKDVDFEFDFLVTNEQADPAKMATNIQAVLTETAQINLNDPRIKLLYDKLLEQLGISPAEIELADQQAQKMMQEQPQEPPQQGSGQIGGGFSANSLMRLAGRSTPPIPSIPTINH
jgi:hypothetical protein